MVKAQFRLFGRLRAQLDEDSTVSLDAGKMKDLLGYLILHRSRPHAREALASLLWCELPTAQARKNLRQLLWHLQTAFEQSAGEDAGQVLLVEPDWVHFNPGVEVMLDVAEFENGFTRVKGIAGERLAAPEWLALRKTVELYGGDLLEECYEDWCIYERARFQQMYLVMLDKLIAYCDHQREYETGIIYGGQVLRYDRACERAHRRLMRLHYLSGDRTGALRQYAQCVTALDEELGVKPAQRTQVLYDQIRADCLIELIPSPLGGDPVTDGVARLQSVRSTLTDLHRQILSDIQSIDHALHGLN